MILKGSVQSIAEPKPLYIQRKLTAECAAKFIAWAKGQGFEKVLAPEELHVTIVFSEEPVDWSALAEDDTELIVSGGARKVKPLGDKGAVVLEFVSERLSARWAAWRSHGASWKWEDYRPHVTITYRNPPEDLKAIQPFSEPLEFEGEIFEPINDSYSTDVVEKFDFFRVLKANPYHDAEGYFTTKEKAVSSLKKLEVSADNSAALVDRVLAQRKAAEAKVDGKLSAKEADAYFLMRSVPEFLALARESGEFAQALKANPWKDADGKFTTKDKDADGIPNSPGKEKVKRETVGIEYVKGLGWTQGGKGLEGEVAARVKALRIPPGWKDVQLIADPDSALQATGVDSKGRKQYLYSAAHALEASAQKFARLASFHENVAKIRKNIDARMSEPDDHIAALRLIDRTGIRIGSDAETGGKHKAYGATTLLGKHVIMSGGQIKLEFEGKHGKKNTRDFYDKKLSEYIKSKNLGPEDRVFSTSDSRVREVMKEVGGQDFSPKDFRTWHGTRVALETLKDQPKPKTEAEAKKLKAEVAKKVSEFLSNTPAVALESYIDPKVFDMHFDEIDVKKAELVGAEYPNDGWEIMDAFVSSVVFVEQPELAGEPEDD